MANRWKWRKRKEGFMKRRNATMDLVVLCMLMLCVVLAPAVRAGQGRYIINGMASDVPPPPAPRADAVEQAGSIAAGGQIAGDRTTINFDDGTQPCNFDETTRLTTRYAGSGVTFAGPSGLDGAAILNECGAFSVSGFSPPNFLAWNTGASLSDGGIPRLPETLYFSPTVSSVSLKAAHGSSSSGTFTAIAYNSGGSQLDTETISLGSTLAQVTLTGTAIYRVVLSTTAGTGVIDDVVFDGGAATNTPTQAPTFTPTFTPTVTETPTPAPVPAASGSGLLILMAALSALLVWAVRR